MGAKLFGQRKAMNDNAGGYRKPLDEEPIKAEDFRHAPVIEKEPGFGWYCLIAVPQNEYRCADALGERGIPTYVPTDTHWTRRLKGREWRKIQVQMPVFRGYVFARLPRPAVKHHVGWSEVVCDDAWAPIQERDTFKRSPHGILGVIGFHGMPLAMPLRRVEERDGEMVRTGVADFADDERAGWFDDRRRPGLIAARDARPLPRVLKGEEVQPQAGAFRDQVVTADNDNDDRGYVKLRSQLFGGAATFVMHIDDLLNLTRPQDNAAEGLRRA